MVLNTSPEAGDLRDVMASIYADLYVECVAVAAVAAARCLID